MFDAQVIAFFGVALVLTLTPGADTMLTIRNAVAGGRLAGLFTALGIISGLLFHALLSSLGFSVILTQSAAMFNVVKFIGAMYLIYLGAVSLWQMWRGGDAPQATHIVAPSRNRYYRQGLLTNLLNPKVAVFYLAFLPQFIQPDDPVIAKSVLLAGIHMLQGLLWLGTISLLIAYLRDWLLRDRVRRVLEGFAGTVLVVLGVRLALERA